MNYTFLPRAEHDKMQNEYRIRVSIVFLFFISISFIIGAGSLFPAYIYATIEEQLHLGEVANFKKSVDAASINSNQKQLTTSAGLLSSLDQYLEKDIYYSTISSIVSMKGNTKISSIALDRSNPTTMNISISGNSPTRSDLLAFKSRLANLSSKTLVDLPISTLARDSEISFTLQVTETLQ